MSIFITGATGFIGSYVANVLLRETDHELALLTRAPDYDAGVEKFWRAMQLHMDAPTFYRYLDRVCFIPGDLTKEALGISTKDRDWLLSNAESVIHIAASLNRRSEKSCLNHNLRGTLSVIELARAIHEDHGLRRFSHVSTVAVAGQRDSEVVREDEAIDWERSDYDPYGRTKKFCEHMVRTLLPDIPKTFFRPSTVMGDSRFPETSQFDMVRSFCFLVDLPIIPFSGDVRVDIVNADWVGRVIATIHAKDQPDHEIYNLSAGVESRTAFEIATALSHKIAGRKPRFNAALQRPFEQTMRGLAALRERGTLQTIGSLFTVFMPYITYDTVFDNSRAVNELGVAPVPFTEYAAGLYRYAKSVKFNYPAVPLPEQPDMSDAVSPRAGGAR